VQLSRSWSWSKGFPRSHPSGCCSRSRSRSRPHSPLSVTVHRHCRCCAVRTVQCTQVSHRLVMTRDKYEEASSGSRLQAAARPKARSTLTPLAKRTCFHCPGKMVGMASHDRFWVVVESWLALGCSCAKKKKSRRRFKLSPITE